VGEVAQTLMGLAPSASAISRLNRDEEPIATQQSGWHQDKDKKKKTSLMMGFHYALHVIVFLINTT
jgi:hypothetical protein